MLESMILDDPEFIRCEEGVEGGGREEGGRVGGREAGERRDEGGTRDEGRGSRWWGCWMGICGVGAGGGGVR